MESGIINLVPGTEIDDQKLGMFINMGEDITKSLTNEKKKTTSTCTHILKSVPDY